MINIKDFDPNLLKIDQKSYKNIDIYYIGYITVKYFYYVKIYSVNPLYLIISEVDGYIKEKNGSKYLVFDSANENNEIFEDIGFKYEPYLCNGCHGLMQKAISFNDVAIVYVKGSAYRIHFWYMSKDDAISIMNNSNLIDKMGVL